MSKKVKSSKPFTLTSWETVQPTEITWLFEPYIPFGKITIISGDPSAGKTTFALDLISRITNGCSMPFSDAKPITGNVIFQSHEDGLRDTLIPRCLRAGADVSRIKTIEADDFNIDDDCDIIEQCIKETNARLVCLDPLQLFLGKNADMCRITDIRRIFTKLGKVAERNNCAVIVIAHQNKSQGGNDLHRVFGSVDITAVARSVLRVSASEIDPETRIVTNIKNSVSRPGEPIAFRIEDNAPILYLSEYDGDFDDNMIPVDFCKKDKATEIISTMLAESPKEGTEIYSVCKAAGIGSRTVEKVKKELNVRSGRDELNRRVWILE
jgi:RecA-family ATPase